MAILISYPWIALAVACAFGGAWYWRHARTAAIAGALWLLYAAYEYLIYTRILCSGECNIRIDLLVFYPLLLAASLVAIWNTVRVRATRVRRTDSSS